MVRRDYFLRMIEEFIQALMRIDSLKTADRWEEAAEALDEQFLQLLGEGPDGAAKLSETELLARLMQQGPTHLVRQKTFMLATLLKEAGDVKANEERPDESHECYLKALHLVLDTLGQVDAAECPEFVPEVEVLVEALNDSDLPLRTHALLMQHYERTGQFARAENELFELLDAEPHEPRLFELGHGFYQRLIQQSDRALEEGDLPRTEVEAGLKELTERNKR